VFFLVVIISLIIKAATQPEQLAWEDFIANLHLWALMARSGMQRIDATSK
jgi:hypothetical protein